MHKLSVVELNQPLSSIYFNHSTTSVKAKNMNELSSLSLMSLQSPREQPYKGSIEWDSWEKGFKEDIILIYEG